MEISTKNLLGLAMKAGKIISGEEACMRGFKKKIYLVIVAKDASLNTTNTFKNKCAFYNIPLRLTGTKEELGMSIGKTFRAVLAVRDKEFAVALLKSIDNG